MQKPLRTGLYTFFLRYSRFSLNSLHKAIFNELFLFQQSPDVAFKRNIGIRLCDARNEKNETWFLYRVRVRAKRRSLGIQTMVRLSECALFPARRTLEKSFFFLTRRIFIAALRGNMFSALISSSL